VYETPLQSGLAMQLEAHIDSVNVELIVYDIVLNDFKPASHVASDDVLSIRREHTFSGTLLTTELVICLRNMVQ
jgi:hypothetical protein